MLKILFIGDIIGSIGRKGVAKLLPKLKKKYQPDLTIANAENLAHGLGVTEGTLQEVLNAGVDYFTSGNHIFDRPGNEKLLNEEKWRLLRPANYPLGSDGVGERVINISQYSILLLNLMGRVFIEGQFNCPFRAADAILKKYESKKIDAVIVDFHAEATSEKKALGHYLDGRVTAVLGTHTHVQTADEEILSGGTAYISDAGMVGAADSVIGVDKKTIIHNFLNQETIAFEPPKTGRCLLNAVLLTIDTDNKKATSIKRIIETTKIS
ncbi:TIGR00282 family metallophosphoesterase [Candidatus Falkowbacteria bacterium CG10_big_fil_rev_8_21_14_0_10_43_11]|uniref:TIGR00282 family metallophosphoesterase n=1 Tax=Candidatus Falkowbacteria bacterium CG10_big_fil_rev_8_21_14_0_10_43_11 TaxID=1974568 RepID=A0A2M6WMW1_9BACT|nr:MAG: TIGR00282 family metallophosphoesterase [Candidatus Falkowbacteria bacterium CG10_big_fil_rev_8_21_14_0_10_43_11]